MKIDLRIPEPVQPIINGYFSDIDFITVLSHRASPIDLEHICRIHQSLEKAYPTWKCPGVMFRQVIWKTG